MSSAIGDMVNNPAIKQNDQNKTGLLSRFLQETARGSVSLPDMFHNAGTRVGDLLANALGAKTPSASPQSLNPAEKSLQDSGIIDPKMSAPQTFGDYVAQGLGRGVGSLSSLLPLKGGTSSLLGSVPRAMSTVGSIAAPAVVAPKIDELSGHNPMITIPTEIMASILGGRVGGGIGSTLAGKESLPEYTAAQQAYMEAPDSRRTKDLIAKQLDLGKKDPKSADILDQIGKKQEEKIIAGLTPSNPIAPDEITGKIKDYTNDLIAQRGNEYKTAKATIMENPQAVDASSTLDLIDQLTSEAALGSPLHSALAKVQQLIVDNAGDPSRVMKAKTAIQNMAKYSPDLHLDSETDAVMKRIAHQFGQDIDQSMPGYNAMNENYSNQTNNLKGVINGLGGKIVATGETAPSSLPRKMFEKIDPELSPQLQGILPPDMYKQAAQSYLGDVLQRAQTTPTKNVYNNGSQMYKMGDILEKNYPTLQSTLPAEELAKVDDAMKGIDVTMMGRPRNDYTIQSRRSVGVGDEVKGLGKITDMVARLGMKMGGQKLNRNEMLTGISPASQIVGGIGRPSLIAGIQNENPDLTQQQPLASQPVQNIPAQNQNASQSPSPNAPNAIDDVMKKYGIGGTNPNAPSESTNAIDDVMKKYGVSGSTDKTPSGANVSGGNSKGGRILTKDEINFLGKALDGDQQSLMNFDESYNNYKATTPYYNQDEFKQKVKDIIASKESKGSGDYQAQAPNSSAAGRYQFLDATRNKILPGISRDDFINNPDIQEVGMDKLMDSNINDFKNAGINVDNVQPQNLAGMLMAAHLRGSRAGINAYQDPDYQGIPDPNGTLPRSYYDYASSSY